MATLNLAIMPRGSWTNQRMAYFDFFTEHSERMGAVVILRIGKFKAVIRLNNFRLVSEIGDGSFYKIDCAVAALFKIGINKSFS